MKILLSKFYTKKKIKKISKLKFLKNFDKNILKKLYRY